MGDIKSDIKISVSDLHVVEEMISKLSSELSKSLDTLEYCLIAFRKIKQGSMFTPESEAQAAITQCKIVLKRNNRNVDL